MSALAVRNDCSEVDERPFMQVAGVHFAYTSYAPVLKGVTFDVHRGEMITLLGPNGAGKSTLLNCMMNLLSPQQGHVSIKGRPVSSMSQKEIAQLVAYVPQHVDVAFAYTVRDYVVMGRAPFIKMCTSPSKEDYALVDRALERLEIEDLRNRVYCELSGGQRQLVDVARALVQGPHLIMFDEPTSALDYGNQVRVLELVHALSRDEGYAIIMTTHNPDHPILLESSVCLLDRKGVLRKGSVDEIMQEDILASVYDAPLIIRDVQDARRRVCITPRFI